MMTRFDVPSGTTLRVPFGSYDASGASVALSGLAVTDIEIYKDGSTTQRASDAGYTLLDTDGIDFDSVTGLNAFSIDLSDNTDSGFFAVGSEYWVVVSSVTVDTETVNFIACWFRIVAAETSAGTPKADVSHWLGTAAATPTVAGVPEVDVTHWIGTAAATPTTAGVPEVDITHIAGSAVSTSSAQLGVNVVNAAGTAWASGAITASVIATDAIDADAVAANTIDASALAADAVTEIAAGISIPSAAVIADAVWDEDATAHQTQGTFGQAIGDPVADTNTLFKAVVTDATGATVGVDVADVLVDTAEIGAAGAGLTAINLPNQTMDIVGNITGNLSGSVGSVGTGGITATSIATDAIDADALAASAVDEILDEVIAGSTTLRELLRGFAAALLGKASGLGTTTAVYRNIADSMNVISATVDADGNRTAVTLDLDDTP